MNSVTGIVVINSFQLHCVFVFTDVKVNVFLYLWQNRSKMYHLKGSFNSCSDSEKEENKSKKRIFYSFIRVRE